MKIGIDLKAFTTDSRFRGIGMVAKYLLEGTMEILPEAEFHYLNMYSGYEGDLPESGRQKLHSYYTGPKVIDVGTRQLFSDPRADSILKAQIQHFIKQSGIDIMFFSSPHEYGNLFKPGWFEGIKTVGILYDLIPLVFPNQYLYDETFKADYFKSLDFVKSLDVVITISEATKADAIKYLKLPESKIKVVYLGVSPDFTKPERVNIKKLKEKYNIAYPFIMFTGGIEFRKNLHMLIRAYAALKPQYKNKYQLFIIGEKSEEAKDWILHTAWQNGIEGRVVCTGFVSKEDLIALYGITALFVFPSFYEGFGLPVIEAMACGAKVVTSDNSSLKEIAKGYAVLVNPKSVRSIAKGITQVLSDPVRSLERAQKAIPYAKSFTWTRAARKVAQIISDMYTEENKSEKNFKFSVSNALLKDIAGLWLRSKTKLPLTKQEALTIGKQLVILEDNVPQSCPGDLPTVYFDMTVVSKWIKANYITGIARTSLGLYRQFKKTAKVIPVSVEGKDKLILKRVHDITWDTTDEIVTPTAGDIYLMPELQLKGTQMPKKYIGISSLRKKGVTCCSILYDVLPVTMPQYFEKDTSRKFTKHVEEMILSYDAIISISKASVDDLIGCLNTKLSAKPDHNVKLGYFHLGMDSFESTAYHKMPAETEDFFYANSNVFIMIGTIEPRKGHELVLQAFEEMWKEAGLDIALCIIGRVGWNMAKFIEKLNTHEEKGKRLWALYDAPDSCLKYAYANASALIQASGGEGFGLPLIEAGQFGLPILCSNIPVFREIAEENVLYFNSGDVKSLKACVKRFTETAPCALPKSSKISSLTWEESAERLFNMIANDTNKWYAEINTDGKVKRLG